MEYKGLKQLADFLDCVETEETTVEMVLSCNLPMYIYVDLYNNKKALPYHSKTHPKVEGFGDMGYDEKGPWFNYKGRTVRYRTL